MKISRHARRRVLRRKAKRRRCVMSVSVGGKKLERKVIVKVGKR